MPGRDHPSDHATHPPDGDGPPGVRATFTSFADGLRQYVAARGELLTIESREAARVAARKGALAAVIGTSIFAAYALLLVAAVSVTGHWLHDLLPGKWSQFGWQTAALLAGLLHLAIAAGCFRALRRPPRQALFEVTRSELQKDRQWLNDQQIGNEKKS